MLVNEKNALSNECPMYDEQLNCSASKCMMWRWQNGAKELGNDEFNKPIKPLGYCGLAGRPYNA